MNFIKIIKFILIILAVLYNCVNCVDFNNQTITIRTNNFQKGYNNELCDKQFSEILMALNKYDPWAMEFIDSWGKIPSGIFWGHMADLGNFEECLNIQIPLKNFQSQYCLIKIPLKELLPSNKTLIRMVSSVNEISDLTITLGICVPASCSPNYLNISLKDFIKNQLNVTINLKISPNTCRIQEDIKFTTIDIFAIVFFGIIALILLLSTIYDYWMRKLKKLPIAILISFSVLTNGEKLFKFPVEKSKNMIGCLNGIRCMSIIWVVYGHTYLITSYLPHINLIKTKEWLESPYSMFIQTGTVSVDSFFFLSGFLLSWVAFKEMENKGKLNIFLMYFHRYIRLTPILAVAILFYISLLKYLGTGPFWNSFLMATRQNCEDNWWATLIYINNYYQPDKMCLGHSWYLAVDTQLYILSPLLLIPTYKWGKKFLLPTTIILSFLSIGCSFANIMIHDFSMLVSSQVGRNPGLRMKNIYYPTHTRYTPWLIGIVSGYFMYQNRTKSIKLSKGIVALGWLISSIIQAAVIFGPYPHIKPNNIATTIESAFYEPLSRLSWTIALLWIVFACQNGYGGFVNSFLSYTFWQVFARITYSIYIIHMIVEIVNSGNTKTDTHFSNYDVMLRFWSDFGLTILISIVAVLTFESPILGIEKAIFRKRNTNSESQPNNKFKLFNLFKINGKSDSKISLT